MLAHFDLAKQQMPENITLEPDGSADVTFSAAGQVARVTKGGATQILAQLPLSTESKCPIVPFTTTVSGIVRDQDGTLYVGLCTGTANLQGIWRVVPGRPPIRIAALPPAGFPNGLALDERTRMLYVADSALGTVWKVPVRGGVPSVWATGPALAPITFIGANGIKVHDGAVWVTNTDRGTLLRFPVRFDGSAGPVEVRATDLAKVDDFAFTGTGCTVLAALNEGNEVALVLPDGRHKAVLARADGLSNPSSVAVRGDTVYVTSAAYLTQDDPNLLVWHQ